MSSGMEAFDGHAFGQSTEPATRLPLAWPPPCEDTEPVPFKDTRDARCLCLPHAQQH
jgi:hypothetical protein